MNPASSYTQTKDSQDQITPQDALSMLKDGNTRFLKNATISRDLHGQIAITKDGQAPFAALVSCIDSRVPPEVVFDQGIGDIFVGRVAGNVVDGDLLGSLEFACKVAGSKLVLVLGHSSCGAVKGAFSNVELGNLTGLLEKIQPAIATGKGEYPDNDDEALKAATYQNVKNTMGDIRNRSAVLAEMENAGEIIIAGALYHVESGEVEFL
jgi:carbonic anhydrase